MGKPDKQTNKNKVNFNQRYIYFDDPAVRAIFVWAWKMVSVSVCYLFVSQWMKRSKHGLFFFLPKKTLIWRRHCSIGQSCCSKTSKRSFDWFLESSRACHLCPGLHAAAKTAISPIFCNFWRNRRNRSFCWAPLYLLYHLT